MRKNVLGWRDVLWEKGSVEEGPFCKRVSSPTPPPPKTLFEAGLQRRHFSQHTRSTCTGPCVGQHYKRINPPLAGLCVDGHMRRTGAAPLPPGRSRVAASRQDGLAQAFAGVNMGRQCRQWSDKVTVIVYNLLKFNNKSFLARPLQTKGTTASSLCIPLFLEVRHVFFTRWSGKKGSQS